MNARDIAFKVLGRVEADQAFAAAALASELGAVADEREARLAHEIVYGVLRTRPWLDHLLAGVSRRGLDKIDPLVRRILRIGVYQIAFLKRVPASASVNHAVESVRRSRAPRLSGLVNALLRRLSEMSETDLVPGPPVAGQTAAEVGLLEGQPPWIVQKLISQYGHDRAVAMTSAFNQTSRRTLRININAVPREAAIARLGAGVTSGELSPWSVDVADARCARRAADEGWAAYQDEAAQLAALALAPHPGERILDACAGRGGKSGAIAVASQGKADVVAVDRSRSKLERLSFELGRQGFDVHTEAADLTTAAFSVKGPFDAVLLDAPCSGSGTLGRRPEIRWRLAESSVESLRDLQYELLESCSKRVAPGGRLLFVVCSVFYEEGIGNGARFLDTHPDFTFQEIPPSGWPPRVPWNGGKVLVDPGENRTDGYQLVSLKRRGEIR